MLGDIGFFGITIKNVVSVCSRTLTSTPGGTLIPSAPIPHENLTRASPWKIHRSMPWRSASHTSCPVLLLFLPFCFLLFDARAVWMSFALFPKKTRSTQSFSHIQRNFWCQQAVENVYYDMNSCIFFKDHILLTSGSYVCPRSSEKSASKNRSFHPVMCTHYTRDNGMCQLFPPPTKHRFSIWNWGEDYQSNCGI